ncbi:hypothetical protein DPMN_167849 [Dreissena polymorpha]|uniref:Uncharacterized protein n=1 Tax=Dreissena polymorpha TaxID=45954 RepID=A0A9D4IZ42_DREPO|nr:hypothetical protein DPMN_167849 [Dreissena polymorpha]
MWLILRLPQVQFPGAWASGHPCSMALFNSLVLGPVGTPAIWPCSIPWCLGQWTPLQYGLVQFPGAWASGHPCSMALLVVV